MFILYIYIYRGHSVNKVNIAYGLGKRKHCFVIATFTKKKKYSDGYCHDPEDYQHDLFYRLL